MIHAPPPAFSQHPSGKAHAAVRLLTHADLVNRHLFVTREERQAVVQGPEQIDKPGIVPNRFTEGIDQLVANQPLALEAGEGRRAAPLVALPEGIVAGCALRGVVEQRFGVDELTHQRLSHAGLPQRLDQLGI